MNPGDTIYLSDGAYLHFTSDSLAFELRANHHENPTDTVVIDGEGLGVMLHAMAPHLSEGCVQDIVMTHAAASPKKEDNDEPAESV